MIITQVHKDKFHLYEKKKTISSSILNIIYFPSVVQGGKELKWSSLISEKEAYVTNKLIKLKWEQK